MKLFYSPGACSLAAHIALEEAGADFEPVRTAIVDDQQRAPEFLAKNPQGRVPVLEIDGQIVDLSPKEFDLLASLMRQKNNVLTRETLCETVWGHALTGMTRTVDVHIGRLRKKLGKYEHKIETVERVGYRFIPEK